VEKKKKSAMIRFPVILLAVSAILLCASPCAALEVPLPGGETTLNVDYPINESVTVKTGGNVDYPINESVTVKTGGTLNLLDGGEINGLMGIGIEAGGTLNIQGGYISSDVYVAGGSEVNIMGGGIGGIIGAWDIAVAAEAKVTVFGTDFSVENGEIDSSKTYFTPIESFCLLTGTYGGDAGDIDLLFYVFSLDVRIFLAAPVSDVIIDIKPGSNQNNINLKSKGVVPVAVLTTDDFDAGMVNPATAQFAGASPERWKLEDVDDDGDDDMLLHFRTQELDLDQNSTQATLTALLTGRITALVSGGTTVSGTDEVQIVSSKKSKKKK